MAARVEAMRYRSEQRLATGLGILLCVLTLSGCGTYMVASTAVGITGLAVKGAVGTVKLTGKAVGAVTGIGGDDEEDEDA